MIDDRADEAQRLAPAWNEVLALRARVHGALGDATRARALRAELAERQAHLDALAREG